MKMITILSLFSLFVFSSVLAQSSDENEIASLVETLRKAMIDADKSTLENLAAAELSYGHSGGKIETKVEFMEAIISGKNDFKTITLSDQTISIVGNVAIVRHAFAAEVINNGSLQTPKIGVLLIWKKQQNKWLLLARQAFKP
ncbi:MAG: nuclear transport factor 2 family protein [Bacteroidia bacterium]|nr:nuclear transport factor 2 family protein [Bacteroidia bacterium]